MRRFRRKYIASIIFLLLLVLTATIYIIHENSRIHPASQIFFPTVFHKKVIIDAGHGGLDGGAVSPSGVAEAGINLQISLKTSALMRLLGLETILTRADENSLNYNADASTRDNKNADLHARYDIAVQNQDCDFLSIHLNKFGQQSVKGAQVFYSPNRDESLELANALQESLCQTLDPKNHRRAKMAPGDVYLMKTINSPAVTIECGFLSNNAEEAMLVTDEYQKKLAIAITNGYINYLAGISGPPD